MKLRFYIITILFASTSLYAMEPNPNETQKIEDDATTVLTPPLTPPTVPPATINLNTQKDKSWNPGRHLSSCQLAAERNKLYAAAGKPKVETFKAIFNNYPWDLRTEAVINGCLDINNTLQDNLEKQQAAHHDFMNKEQGKKHDTSNLIKHGLIEAGIGAACLLSWFIPTTYRVLNKRTYTFDNPYLIKTSFVLLTAILLIKPFFNSIDAIKQAWNYQNTLIQKDESLTQDRKHAHQMKEYMDDEEIRTKWLPGFNGRTISIEKDNKKEVK